MARGTPNIISVTFSETVPAHHVVDTGIKDCDKNGTQSTMIAMLYVANLRKPMQARGRKALFDWQCKSC